VKREARNHSKIKRFCRKLDVPVYQAMGVLECLWHLTATEAWRGDIGKLSNEDIALALDYRGDENELIEALVDCGWLDRSVRHRLLVHDWAEHADAAIQKRAKRAISLGQSGFCLDISGQSGFCLDISGQSGQMSRNGSLPEPEPEPVPEPVPVPEPRAAPPEENPEGQPITPAMVVSGVLVETAIAGRWLRAVLEQVVSAEAKKPGYEPGALRDRMVESWKQFERAKAELEYTVGAEKFFGEGHWRDSTGWPWKGRANGKQNRADANANSAKDSTAEVLRRLGLDSRGTGETGDAAGRTNQPGSPAVVDGGTLRLAGGSTPLRH
jgi:hypothetical protein